MVPDKVRRNETYPGAAVDLTARGTPDLLSSAGVRIPLRRLCAATGGLQRGAEFHRQRSPVPHATGGRIPGNPVAGDWCCTDADARPTSEWRLRPCTSKGRSLQPGLTSKSGADHRVSGFPRRAPAGEVKNGNRDLHTWTPEHRVHQRRSAPICPNANWTEIDHRPRIHVRGHRGATACRYRRARRVLHTSRRRRALAHALPAEQPGAPSHVTVRHA